MGDSGPWHPAAAAPSGDGAPPRAATPGAGAASPPLPEGAPPAIGARLSGTVPSPIAACGRAAIRDDAPHAIARTAATRVRG